MDSHTFAKFAYILYISCQFLWLSTLSQAEQSPKQCSFPAIFNFGDSNSDTASRTCKEFRHIIDFMASNLNLPEVKRYNDSDGANYTTGANFAVEGATTLPYPPKTFLDAEYQNFVRFVQKSQLISNKGVMPKKDDFSQALYTIDIGQNDIGNRIKNLTAIDEINAMVPRFVDAIVAYVKLLHAKGARFFWIHNTGPIGCLPNLYREDRPLPLNDQKDEVGCIVPYNKVCQYFNQKLKESVASLRAALPSAAITYVDMYSIKYSIYNQYKKYGFDPPPYSDCSCNKEICARQVFADCVHYTEAANKVFFDLMLTGKFSDPPIAPNLACNQ